MLKKYYLSIQNIDGESHAYLWKTKESAIKSLSDEDYSSNMAYSDAICDDFLEEMGLAKLKAPTIIEVMLNFDLNGYKRCPCGHGYIKNQKGDKQDA